MKWSWMLVVPLWVIAAGQPSGVAGTKGRDGFWVSANLRLTRITPAGGYWFAPVTSPDGRWLAVRRRTGVSPADDLPYGPLWLLPASGGAAQAFSRTVVSNYADWEIGRASCRERV